MVKKKDPVLYGLFAGAALIVFYLLVVSIFQDIQFAFMNLRNWWYLIIPLVAGFGTQIGLFFSIKHTAHITGTVSSTGAISGGSMVACCSHFLLNIIPIAGATGVALIIMKYQGAFLAIGVASNILGISLMIRHKRKMKMDKMFLFKNQKDVKGGLCCVDE